MSRLIDADDPKLREKLKFIREAEGQIYGRASWCFSAKCEAAIDDAQTVDAVPVVHGRWIVGEHLFRQCNRCRYERMDDNPNWDTNFCPDCGADMRRDGGDGSID